MAEQIAGQVCETLGCGKPAKLQCPACIKLSITGSFFCEQACFKGNWKTHKAIHTQTQNFDPWPGYSFSGPLRPYPQSRKRTVPLGISRPDYADHPEGYPQSEADLKRSTQIQVMNTQEIESMRVVCKLAREVLDIAAKAVKPGVTTDYLDELVHEATVERNCYPSPLNYHTFPKSCCTSVNEVICHGIPDERKLQEGDIVNLDITCFYNGYHGDLNETVFVGKPDEDSLNLVKTSYECLMAAIEQVKPGVRYRDVGTFIQKRATESGCSVTRTYCGHGIHSLFHTAPSIPHYAKNKAIGVMKAGHVFTIEPMINRGVWNDNTWPDNWTAVTTDGKRSAQFEQTMMVTETGVDILSERREKNGRPHFMDQLEQWGMLPVANGENGTSSAE